MIMVLPGCDDSYLVGSEDVNVIEDVVFSISSYTAGTSSLKCKGTVKNVGAETILPPWYVEGHFYSDSTLTLKLGGARDKITISLEVGTTTYWSLEFSAEDIDESLYPNFKVSQLRAYYENN